MNKRICIHGHFYQPPRENPWLEAVEIQDSAYPYHDWNQRITAECYAPNTASRVLDHDNLVTGISRNYARISFNFGPTLLSWMETEMPAVYQAILKADRDSMERFSGHGAAMAQAYNHLIMPLANDRDRRTQVLWGIRDFEKRFGRRPEGMWLPETAVDTPTLEELAEQEIKFTVLAPRQAAKARRIGDREWKDVSGDKVDTTRPYLCKLPSGREIVLFFYDGAISREVAFNQLLDNGSVFADRLIGAAPAGASHNPLVHIATDGETYGHHHRFGDMALAAALDAIDSDSDVEATIYAEYLDENPPEYEAQIIENSSWSCVHGVERWRSDCGCNTGGHSNWNQRWRAPLRDALDWLRDAANPLYESGCFGLLKSPWDARDDYVNVVLDRSLENVDRFFAKHAVGELSDEEKSRALKLLELQRHLMLIYTSCGWFFDEISAIEPVQVIEYSGRAIQLASQLFEKDLETDFLGKLYEAKSNIRENKDGKEIYLRWVKPQAVDLKAVAAHSAISSLYERDDATLSAFEVAITEQERADIGRVIFTTGLIQVKSSITLESDQFQFAALSMGDHNISCGLLPILDRPLEKLREEFADSLRTADVPDLLRDMDRVFEEDQFSLRGLFRDEQRRILNLILKSATDGAEGVYQALYEQQVPVMRFLRDLGNPVPQAFSTAAEYFLNSIIRKELERLDQPTDFSWVGSRLEEAVWMQVNLDNRGLGLLLENAIYRMLRHFREGPADTAELQRLETAVHIARNSSLEVDLWNAQTVTFEMAHSDYLQAVKDAEAGDEDRGEWAELFRSLASNVSVKLP